MRERSFFRLGKNFVMFSECSVDEIFQCDVKEKIMCQLIKFLPQRQSDAVLFPAAGFGVGHETGHRYKRPLRQLDNLTDDVFLWRFCKLITASFSAKSLQQFVFYQDLQDDFQIFFRNFLAGGNILQRYIFVLGMLGQINQNSECIACFC